MNITESLYLPEIKFPQQSELIALTWACQLAKDQVAGIYIDSHYAFGVACDYGMLLVLNFLRTAHKKMENWLQSY